LRQLEKLAVLAVADPDLLEKVCRPVGDLVVPLGVEQLLAPEELGTSGSCDCASAGDRMTRESMPANAPTTSKIDETARARIAARQIEPRADDPEASLGAMAELPMLSSR
jgi:hypothetical protein